MQEEAALVATKLQDSMTEAATALQVQMEAIAVSRIITASILHFKEHTTYCLRLSMATGT